MYMSAKMPMMPPTAAPEKRRTPFCMLAPIVERDTTKHVMTEV